AVPSPSTRPATRPSIARPRRLCESACADRFRLRSLPVPFPEVATDGAPADRPQWGRLATLLSGHAGAPRTTADDKTRAGQPLRDDSDPTSQPAANSELTGASVTSRSVRP